MADFLQKLPTVLVLAVLVSIFVALQRHNPVPRVRLWIAAWGLIFIHFAVQLFEPMPGWKGKLADAIDTGALLLSGVVFLVSMVQQVGKASHRYGLLFLLGVPCVVYTTLDTWDVSRRWMYLACLIVVFGGGGVYVLARREKGSVLRWGLLAMIVAWAVWAFRSVWWGHHDIGVDSLLGAAFMLPALEFWRRYHRWTPGVVTTVGGFFAWGLVFPVGYLVDTFAPKLPVNPEMWNVPKFFVAFGMILAMLEDASAEKEQARRREHALNQQMQRFADITSRLLGGVDVRQMSGQIARTITEATHFRRAAIFLSDDNRNLYLAGQSGLDERGRAHLEATLGTWTLDSLRPLCCAARRIGQNSFRLDTAELKRSEAGASGISSSRPSSAPEARTEGVVIPLVSAGGRYVGFISLEDPREAEGVAPEEMSKVELLAADLAMAMENSTLQRQLVRSEKLAGIGQLVAGVAHELNNPLTAVLGYASLMTEEAPGENTQRWSESLGREAERMKRIIQNLLRFSRQNKPERKPLDLASLTRGAVSLCEYQLGRNGIQVEMNLQPRLPLVLADEDQMKQVLLNLMKNAMDAVETSAERRISISANAPENRVVLEVRDTGPGFPDLDRAFDPFFTTKPVGRGSGLGLSICYGIIKEHGGEIQAHNLRPHGARVTLELAALPAGESRSAADSPATSLEATL